MPQLDNPNDPNAPLVDPQTESLKLERSLSDRILAYAFAASVVINIGWMVWVSRSDLFGAGNIIPPMKETQIKVFKRPLPPKPRTKPKPPPPPPKQPKPPPPRPQPHLIQHPRPTPPQPHQTQIRVATTHSNQASPNRFVVPDVPGPTSPPTPSVPTYETPTPPAPPVPPTPPAPVSPPSPPAPVYQAPPAPLPPRPKLADREAPEIIGSFSDLELPQFDASTLKYSSVDVSWDVDEHGRVSNIVFKPTGNSDVDDAIEDQIRKFRFRPRVVNGVAESAHLTHTFQLAN